MIYTVTLNPAIDKQITVDTVALDTVLRATAVQVDAGGKGFNVSRALATQGVQNCALGFVGGAEGDFLTTALEEQGVQTEFVRLSQPTRTNVSVVGTHGDAHFKVNEAGPTIDSTAEQALISQVRTLAKQGDWWVLAGSLPPGIDRDIYNTLATIIRDAGAFVALDTSGNALANALAFGADLVKPNHHEAAELIGKPISTLAEAAAAALDLQAQGGRYVVISMGGQGAVIAANGQAWQAEAAPIEEQNPIGAGDAMVAGLVRRFSEGATGADALQWGMATGAVSASLTGTDFGTNEQVSVQAQRTNILPAAR